MFSMVITIYNSFRMFIFMLVLVLRKYFKKRSLYDRSILDSTHYNKDLEFTIASTTDLNILVLYLHRPTISFKPYFQKGRGNKNRKSLPP